MICRRRTDNSIANDNGFTLVELIICVAILGLASVALLQSFSVSAVTNRKAQRQQNATSLAESVMEEVKSSGIKQLQKNYNGAEDTEVLLSAADTSAEDLSAAALAAVGDGASSFLKGGTADTPYYVLVKKGFTIPQGETFNVTATMRSKPYSGLINDDASDANSIKLPVIQEIDTHTKTVLTSKELNKYDFAAADYFAEHTGEEDTLDIKSKEIIIEKDGSGKPGNDGEINVKCNVIYTADDGATQYRKEVFKGTYVSSKKNGVDVAVDNDIYVFYNRFLLPVTPPTPPNEIITVTDRSTDDNHRVYVIFQKDTKKTKATTDDVDLVDMKGTEIKVSDGSDNKIDAKLNTDIEYDDDNDTSTPKIRGRCKSDDGDYWLITNLGLFDDGSLGAISEKKSRNRIFEVTVDVTKKDDTKKYASITSTIDFRE